MKKEKLRDNTDKWNPNFPLTNLALLRKQPSTHERKSSQNKWHSSKAWAHHVSNGKGISVTSLLQTKLTIWAANDPLEQGADGIAVKAIQMSEPSSPPGFFQSIYFTRKHQSVPNRKGRFAATGRWRRYWRAIPDIQSKFALDAPSMPPLLPPTKINRCRNQNY